MKSNTNKPALRRRISIVRILKAGGIILPAFSILLLVFLLASRANANKQSIYLKTMEAGRYQLIVEGKPFVVKGVCYNPIPIGENYEYNWWSDPAKPWIADGKLMKAMGINVVRIYKSGQNPEAVKQVMRDLYSLYGIRTIMGHWLGFWEYPCPLYGNTAFHERIKGEVLEMVNCYKDEPGLLGWILGNENNYACIGTVNPWSTDDIDQEVDPQKQKAMRAKIYYSFVASLADAIHAVDKNHPVGLGNGELIGLEFAKQYCPNVDFVACIIYRGRTFGNLFTSLKATFDKPILVAEFGADAYDAYLKKEDQNIQAFFLEAQWRQIYDNTYLGLHGEGNCIGGTMFEWTDEWWKHGQSESANWLIHDTESYWSNGSYYYDIQAPANKNMNEEWFGIVALSPEKEDGINKRIPRKAYYQIREFWKDPSALAKSQKGKDKTK